MGATVSGFCLPCITKQATRPATRRAQKNEGKQKRVGQGELSGMPEPSGPGRVAREDLDVLEVIDQKTTEKGDLMQSLINSLKKAKRTSVLAIDPGCAGGFAWCCDGEVRCQKTPDTEGDILELLTSLRANHHIERLVIEAQVGCVGPNMKVSGTAMFTFGRGYGFLIGAAMALGYRVELVRPMKWQKPLSLGTKKDAGGNTPWKNKLKSTAQRLFPGADVTLSTADSLLLLDYAMKNP